MYELCIFMCILMFGVCMCPFFNMSCHLIVCVHSMCIYMYVNVCMYVCMCIYAYVCMCM